MTREMAFSRLDDAHRRRTKRSLAREIAPKVLLLLTLDCRAPHTAEESVRRPVEACFRAGGRDAMAVSASGISVGLNTTRHPVDVGTRSLTEIGSAADDFDRACLQRQR